MKILMILTNSFDPDPRVYKEAKTLVEAGHFVDIACWDRDGKHFEKQEECVDGINLKRFIIKSTYGKGYKQIKNFLEFKKMVFLYAAKKPYEAVHCHDFDGLIIGKSIQNKLKLKLVYDEHDFFYLYFKNRKGLINSIISETILIMQNVMTRNIDNHIVVTPKAKEFYKNKKNISIITNAPLRESFNNIIKSEDRPITIGFIGTVRYYNELETLIKVANNYKKIKVIIAGKGTALKKLIEYKKLNEIENVDITGEYQLNQIEKIYSQIDITYLIYPSEDSKISLPNKFFESIITQTPIMSDGNSEYGQIVKNFKLGWIINPLYLEQSIDNIFKEISQDNTLLESYKTNMNLIKENYFWENNVPILLNIYK